MIRCVLISLLFCSIACAGGLSVTTPELNDYVVVTCDTSQFSTGAQYDASAITYTVWECANNTTPSIAVVDATLSGVAMTKMDSELGFYMGCFQCTGALGFELNKNYIVRVEATVDSVTSGITFPFRVVAVLDSDALDANLDARLLTAANITAIPTNVLAEAVPASPDSETLGYWIRKLARMLTGKL